MTITDDRTLLVRWCDGDKSAGRELFIRYYASINRFFANKVASADDATDLTQETFAACTARKDAIQGVSPSDAHAVRRYLYGIAANMLKGYIAKRLKRARESSDFGDICAQDYLPTPLSIVTRRREELILVSALRDLPLDQQIAIELNLFEELSGSEIATVLGVPEGTVRGRLRLGKARLHRRIEELAQSPDELHSTLTNVTAWAIELRRRIDGASS